MGNCLPIFRCFVGPRRKNDSAVAFVQIDNEDSGAEDEEVISYVGKLNKVGRADNTVNEQALEKLHCSSNVRTIQNQLYQPYQHWRQKQRYRSDLDLIGESFAPLSNKDKLLVLDWFNSIGRNVFVIHENTNIHITPENLQCLLPGKWLNDEVINVYLSLLKEREERDPEKFWRCHFFSTFFVLKLSIEGTGYDYRSVKRWTDPNRLGYNLLDCEMFFVPINRERHWSLGIINIRDKKFQYLDSLGWHHDDDGVLNLLARYYVDEVRDKTGKEVDVSQWKRQVVERLPRQENGYDCGVFMIKYVDFISRGLVPIFDQRNIECFRWRTALEIVRLRAD